MAFEPVRDVASIKSLVESVSQFERQVLLEAVDISAKRLYSQATELLIFLRAVKSVLQAATDHADASWAVSMYSDRMEYICQEVNLFALSNSISLLDACTVLFGDPEKLLHSTQEMEEDYPDSESYNGALLQDSSMRGRSPGVKRDMIDSAEHFCRYNLRGRYFVAWRRELQNAILRKDVAESVRLVLHKDSLAQTASEFQLKSLASRYIAAWRLQARLLQLLSDFTSVRNTRILKKSMIDYKRSLYKQSLVNAITFSRTNSQMLRILRSWRFFAKNQTVRRQRLEQVLHRKRVAITTPFFRHWARICTKQRLESTRIRWMTRWRHRQTLDIAFSGWKRYSNVMIGGRLYESQAKTGKLKEGFSLGYDLDNTIGGFDMFFCIGARTSDAPPSSLPVEESPSTGAHFPPLDQENGKDAGKAGKATFLELLLYGWKNCNELGGRVYALKAKFLAKEFILSWRRLCFKRRNVHKDSVLWSRHVLISNAWDRWRRRADDRRRAIAAASGFRVRRIHVRLIQHFSRVLEVVEETRLGRISSFSVTGNPTVTASLRYIERPLVHREEHGEIARRFLTLWREKAHKRLRNRDLSLQFWYISVLRRCLNVWEARYSKKSLHQVISGKIVSLDKIEISTRYINLWRKRLYISRMVDDFQEKQAWFRKRQVINRWKSALSESRLLATERAFTRKWEIVCMMLTFNKWRDQHMTSQASHRDSTRRTHSIFVKWRKRYQEYKAQRLALQMYHRMCTARYLLKWAVSFGSSRLKSVDDRNLSLATARSVTYQWIIPVTFSNDLTSREAVCQIAQAVQLDYAIDSPYISQIIGFAIVKSQDTSKSADHHRRQRLLTHFYAGWKHRYRVKYLNQLLDRRMKSRQTTFIADRLNTWRISLRKYQSNVVMSQSLWMRKTIKLYNKIWRSRLEELINRYTDANVYHAFKLRTHYWNRLIVSFESRIIAWKDASERLASRYYRSKMKKKVLVGLMRAVEARRAAVTAGASVFLKGRRRRWLNNWRSSLYQTERLEVYQSRKEETSVRVSLQRWKKEFARIKRLEKDSLISRDRFILRRFMKVWKRSAERQRACKILSSVGASLTNKYTFQKWSAVVRKKALLSKTATQLVKTRLQYLGCLPNFPAKTLNRQDMLKAISFTIWRRKLTSPTSNYSLRRNLLNEARLDRFFEKWRARLDHKIRMRAYLKDKRKNLLKDCINVWRNELSTVNEAINEQRVRRLVLLRWHYWTEQSRRSRHFRAGKWLETWISRLQDLREMEKMSRPMRNRLLVRKTFRGWRYSQTNYREARERERVESLEQSATNWITLRRLVVSWQTWISAYRSLKFEHERKRIFGTSWASQALKRRALRAWIATALDRKPGSRTNIPDDAGNVLFSMSSIYEFK
ncbi:MAG: hypothetical protein SGCHY_001274 [Lobulomycetales sp.]